jgi:tyrosine aminotransferase
MDEFLTSELQVPQNPDKPILNLGLGQTFEKDGYPLPPCIEKALITSIHTPATNNYTDNTGCAEARSAVAWRYSTPEFPITEDEVCMAFGC